MLLRYLQLSEPSFGNELHAVLDQLSPTAAGDREVQTAVRHSGSLSPYCRTWIRRCTRLSTHRRHS